MVRLLKVTALAVLGVVILACVGIFFFLQACSDQMSACYQAWKTPDSTKRERLGALTQFTASATAIAFPVILDNDERGLLFADRKTGQSKLIYEKDKVFLSPYLSEDGERLVLIQRHVGLARKEIISCSTATWRCAALLRTEDNLRSPIEIDAGTIIFAASPLFVSSEGHHHYMHWDLYLLKKGSAQIRLSDFRLYALDAISAANDKLIFTALGRNSVFQSQRRWRQTGAKSMRLNSINKRKLSASLPACSLHALWLGGIRHRHLSPVMDVTRRSTTRRLA